MSRKLSLVTAVNQDLEGLQRLYQRLEHLLSAEVEWVIKDSGRCEATRIWGESIKSENLKFICSPDTGIYDALNQALYLADGEFYVVFGSDDDIYSEGIAYFLAQYADFSEYGVVVFPVVVNDRILMVKRFCPLFLSTSGIVTSHSVGTIIRRAIHESVGMYDTSYRILSDSLFLTRCIQYKFRFYYLKEVSFGQFCTQGISSTNHKVRILEAYRYNRSCGSSVPTQSLFFLLRVLRYLPALIFYA